MWTPALLALATAFSWGTLEDSGPYAHYSLDVRTPDDAPGDVGVVHVELRLEGLAGRDALELRMPEGVTFITLPEPIFGDESEVRAFAADGAPLGLERLGPRRWRLATKGHEAARLTWSVPQLHRSIPEVAARDAYEFPYVAEDHGMLSGSTLFVTPAEGPESGWRYRVDVRAPEGWSVYAPWPMLSTGGYAPTAVEDLYSNYVAIGTWDVESVTVDGAQVAVLFAPGQDTLVELVRPRLAPILAHELEVFDHRPFESYLVLFGRPDMPGWGGSPKRGSMTLYADPKTVGPMGGDAVVHLLAHEFFHTWSASLFGMPDELRFFGEGFTDYYAHLVPARIGQRTFEAFGREIAAACAAFENNVTAEVGLVDAGGALFFEDPRASKLAYEGGLVVAALTDFGLRARGKGLDEFMRGLINRGGEAPGVDDVIEAWQRELGDELAAALEELLLPDGRFALEAALDQLGVEFDRDERPAELSVRANFQGERVTGIDPGGLLSRVGVRSGDVLTRVNGQDVEGRGERAIRRAWRKPLDGRLEVRLDRGGEAIRIDLERPSEVTYDIDGRQWEPSATMDD